MDLVTISDFAYIVAMIENKKKVREQQARMNLRRLPFVNLTQMCHLTIFVFLNIYILRWGTF